LKAIHNFCVYSTFGKLNQTGATSGKICNPPRINYEVQLGLNMAQYKDIKQKIQKGQSDRQIADSNIVMDEI
jgi:hypothetical protein